MNAVLLIPALPASFEPRRGDRVEYPFKRVCMSAMTTRKTLGNRGESAAAAYLQAKGYHFVEANWRCPQGEFDLIMQQDETFVFVEVRTRKSGLEAAFESITPRKRQILEQLAYLYLEQKQLDCDWRIDVIAISPTTTTTAKIEHLENALDW